MRVRALKIVCLLMLAALPIAHAAWARPAGPSLEMRIADLKAKTAVLVKAALARLNTLAGEQQNPFAKAH